MYADHVKTLKTMREQSPTRGEEAEITCVS